MLNKYNITRERLKELIEYFPDTGEFFSKERRGSRLAGKIHDDKTRRYLHIQIDGKRMAAHRLAYIYVYGYAPPVVDHINGDGHDNRINNLRAADQKRNTWNSKKRSGTGGRFKGYKVKGGGIYEAAIRDGHKQIYLGRTRNEIEAAYLYDLASLRIHGRFGKRNFLPLVNV